MLKIFHSQRKDMNFYKIFSWKKIFIKSLYHKRKKKYQPLFSNHAIPHHQKKNSLKFFLKSCLPTLRNNQTSPSHATQEQTFGFVPIQKKSSLPIHKKNLLWKGMKLPHPPLLTQKKPFWKGKKRVPNLSSPLF